MITVYDYMCKCAFTYTYYILADGATTDMYLYLRCQTIRIHYRVPNKDTICSIGIAGVLPPCIIMLPLYGLVITRVKCYFVVENPCLYWSQISVSSGSTSMSGSSALLVCCLLRLG